MGERVHTRNETVGKKSDTYLTGKEVVLVREKPQDLG